jgi:hypothetical protein
MSLRIAATAVVMNVAVMSAAVALDAKLPPYQIAPDISGQIKSVGSDTRSRGISIFT